MFLTFKSNLYPLSQSPRYIILLVLCSFGMLGLSCLETEAAPLLSTKVAEQKKTDQPPKLQRYQNKVWIYPQEHKLIEETGLLPAIYDNIQKLRKQIGRDIQQNHSHWNQLLAAQKKLKAALTSVRLSSRKQQELRGRLHHLSHTIAQLKQKATTPEKVGQLPLVQKKMIQLSWLHHRLIMKINHLQTESDTLRKQYQQLRANPPRLAQLTAQKPTIPLGPSDSLKKGIRRIKRFGKLMSKKPVPIYLRADHVQIQAIANKHYLVTFSLTKRYSPHLMTHTTGTRLGILPQQKKVQQTTQELLLPNGKKIKTTPVIIQSLQFGGKSLTNVTFHLLPPEAEEIGNQMGTTIFKSEQLNPNLKQLTFTLR